MKFYILVGQFLCQFLKTTVTPAGTALADEGAIIQKEGEGALILAVGTAVAEGTQFRDQLFIAAGRLDGIGRQKSVRKFDQFLPLLRIKQNTHSFSAFWTGL